jgi:hypothetical protein
MLSWSLAVVRVSHWDCHLRPSERVFQQRAFLMLLYVANGLGEGLKINGSLLIDRVATCDHQMFGRLDGHFFCFLLLIGERGLVRLQHPRWHRHRPRLVARQPIWSPSGAMQRYVRNQGRSGSARPAPEMTLMTAQATSRGFTWVSINNVVGTLIYSRGRIGLNLGLVDISRRELRVETPKG